MIVVSLEVSARSLVCGADVVALKVIDVAFKVHKILFIFAVNLNSSQPSCCQILRVIDVNDILVTLFFIVEYHSLLAKSSLLFFLFFNFLACGHLMLYLRHVILRAEHYFRYGPLRIQTAFFLLKDFVVLYIIMIDFVEL